MPIARVRLPDGRIGRFKVPEGMSPEEIEHQVNQQLRLSSKTDLKKSDAYDDTAQDMSFGQQLLAGAGGAIKGMTLGARQLASMVGGDEVPEQEILDYQDAISGLRGTGGGLVGEIGTSLMPGIAAFRVASAIPKVAGLINAGGWGAGTSIAGISSATGGIEGALIPTNKDQTKTRNILTGAGVGVIAPAATGLLFKGASKGIDVAVAPFSQKARQKLGGQLANRVAGDQADDVVSALESSKGIISKQTSGQAVSSSGVVSPEFSALQKVIGDVSPQPTLVKDLQQKANRVHALESFGKTPEELTAAIKSRGINADENYAKAFGNAIRADVDLIKIIRNPFVNDVLGDVRKLLQAKGKKASLTEQLHLIKKQLDKSISGTPLSKPSDDEARAIMSVKDDLVEWITKKNDAYKFAKSEYEAASRPITEMKIGQEAKKILTSNLGSKEKAVALAKAVDDESKLLKAGGFSRASLESQLQPQNVKKINDIMRELDIDANFAEQAVKGMRGENLTSQIGYVVEIPHVLNTAVVITNSLLKKVFGHAKILTLKELNTVSQDPQLMAKIMKEATKREKNAIKFLIRSQQVSGVGATSTQNKGQNNPLEIEIIGGRQ
jgi:hypothetical protein